MPAEPLRFDAKICGFRRAKDGIVISLVVHPEADCIAPLAILPVGFECCVEISGPEDAPTQRIVDAAKTHSQLTNSPSVEATTRKDEGSQLRPIEGETPASRAIKMAHTHAGGSEEVLRGIRDYCGVKSCSEFKTNPGAVKRFHDWEIYNGFVPEPRR